MDKQEAPPLNYAKHALAQSDLIPSSNPSGKSSSSTRQAMDATDGHNRASSHDMITTTEKELESELSNANIAAQPLATQKTSSPQTIASTGAVDQGPGSEVAQTIPGKHDRSLLPAMQNSNKNNNTIATKTAMAAHDNIAQTPNSWFDDTEQAASTQLPGTEPTELSKPRDLPTSSAIFSSSPSAQSIAESRMEHSLEFTFKKHCSTSQSACPNKALRNVIANQSTGTTLSSDRSGHTGTTNSKPAPQSLTPSIFNLTSRKPPDPQHSSEPNPITLTFDAALPADIKVNQDSPWPTSAPTENLRLDQYRDHSKSGGPSKSGATLAPHHQKNQPSNSSSIFDTAARNASAEFTLSASSSLHTHASQAMLPKSRDGSPSVGPHGADLFSSSNAASIFDTLTPGSKQSSIFDAEAGFGSSRRQSSDTQSRQHDTPSSQFENLLFQAHGFLESSTQPPAPKQLVNVQDNVENVGLPKSAISTTRAGSAPHYETLQNARAHETPVTSIYDRHSSQNYSTTNTQLSSSHEIDTSRENLFNPSAYENSQKSTKSHEHHRRHTASPYATIFDPAQLGASWDTGNNRGSTNASHGNTPINPETARDSSRRDNAGLLTTQPNMFTQKVLNSTNQQQGYSGSSKHHQNQDDWPKFPLERDLRFQHELNPKFQSAARTSYSIDELYRVAKKKVCSQIPISETIDFTNKKYLCPRNDKWDPRLYMHAERLRRFPELVERERLAKEKRAVSRQLSEAIKNAQKDSESVERRVDPSVAAAPALPPPAERREERRESPNMRGQREVASAQMRRDIPEARGPRPMRGFQHEPSELILRACRERSMRAKEKSGDGEPAFGSQRSCESVLASDQEVAGFLSLAEAGGQGSNSPMCDTPPGQIAGMVPSAGGPAGVGYTGPANRRPNDDRNQKRGIFDFGNKRDISRGNACFDDWKGAQTRKWKEQEKEKDDGDEEVMVPQDHVQEAEIQPVREPMGKMVDVPQKRPVEREIPRPVEREIPSPAQPVPTRKAFDFAEEIRRRKINAMEKEREKTGVDEVPGTGPISMAQSERMPEPVEPVENYQPRAGANPRQLKHDPRSKDSPVDSAILKIETQKERSQQRYEGREYVHPRGRRDKKQERIPEWAMNDDDTINTQMPLVGMPDDFRSIDPAIKQSSRRLNTDQRDNISRNVSSETDQIQGTWLDEKLRAGSRNKAHKDAIEARHGSPANKPGPRPNKQLNRVFKQHVKELEGPSEPVPPAARRAQIERELAARDPHQNQPPREYYPPHGREPMDPRDFGYDPRDPYYPPYDFPPHIPPHYYTEEIYRERRHQVRHVHPPPQEGWPMDKRTAAYPPNFTGSAPWDHPRAGSPAARQRGQHRSGERAQNRHPEDRRALEEVDRIQEKLRMKRAQHVSGDRPLRPDERAPEQRGGDRRRAPPAHAGGPPMHWDDAPPGSEYWEWMYAHYPEQFDERMFHERYKAANAWHEYPGPPKRHPSGPPPAHATPPHLRHPSKEGVNLILAQLNKPSSDRDTSERPDHAKAFWDDEQPKSKGIVPPEVYPIEINDIKPRDPAVDTVADKKGTVGEESSHGNKSGDAKEQNPMQMLFEDSPETAREKRPSGPRQNLSNWDELREKDPRVEHREHIQKQEHMQKQEHRTPREEYRIPHGREEYHGPRGPYGPEYYEDPREYYEARGRAPKYGPMPGMGMPRHGAGWMPEYDMYEGYADSYDYAYHTRYHPGHPPPPRGGHYPPEWHGEPGMQRSPRGSFRSGDEGRYRGAGHFQGPPPEAYREGGEAWTHDERSHREGWSTWATGPPGGKGGRQGW